jgi:hypothetical protein
VPLGVGLGCRSGRRNWRCGGDGCSVRSWRIRRFSCRGSRGGERRRTRFGHGSAAVAAVCFLIAPVMSSMLLSRSAMRPASRSRSTVNARTCAATSCVSDSSWATRGGIRAKIRSWRISTTGVRSLAGSVLLVIARIFSATTVRPPKHCHKSELGSRLHLRRFRGRLFDLHGFTMDVSLKILAESGKSRCQPGSKVFCRWAG